MFSPTKNATGPVLLGTVSIMGRQPDKAGPIETLRLSNIGPTPYSDGRVLGYSFIYFKFRKHK